MGAETRLATVLFGSVLLWLPALGAVVRGDLEPGAAGVRYAIGAVLVWAAVAAINQLVQGYAVAAPTTGSAPGPSAAAETDDRGPARRRAEDRDETTPAPGSADDGEPWVGTDG